MKKYFKIIFSLIGLTFPIFSLALEYPFGNLSANPTPCEYIKTAYIWGLGIVGTLAVAVIAFGGFLYMVGKVEQGKDYITSAFLGILLLFGAYLILYTINPELAQLKCEIKNMQKFNEAPQPTKTTDEPLPQSMTEKIDAGATNQDIKDDMLK
ncbi:MAG: hypothetical protein PHQ47_00060 [Candidatus Portnoybacteria bacterium]|nr:hypothetical protein [Candidatus Portnoybacteria bacterium]